jgi:hypothetical protein
MRVQVVPYQTESRRAENTRSNITLSRLPTKYIVCKYWLVWFGLGEEIGGKKMSFYLSTGRAFQQY